VFREAVKASEDGQSFESQVVPDVQTADGTSTMMVPNMVTGQRIVVEPMPEIPPMAPPVSG